MRHETKKEQNIKKIDKIEQNEKKKLDTKKGKTKFAPCIIVNKYYFVSSASILSNSVITSFVISIPPLK